MAQSWLLLAFLALVGGQIVYPDQYEIMIADSSHTFASLPNYSAPTLQAASNSQPVPINRQFNQRVIPQFSTARPAEAQFYTTPVPVLSTISPTGDPQSLQETWSNHVTNIISRGITKFALDLDKAIYKSRGTSVTSQRENVIFSPLSVSVALSLVLMGSAGKTFNEIARILGLETGVDISQHSEIVHQMFGQLLAIMNYRIEGSSMPRVNSASGIFVQEGYPIRPEFRAISENAYQSEVINLDFQTKGKEARDTINAWVKQRTMNKIDSILSETPDPLTTVILLSALYFNGEWNQHFLGGMTRRKQFSIEPNTTVEIDMMYNGGNFPFYEDKSLGVKIVGLPYKGLEMSMYVLLPKTEGAAALRNFQDQLTAETIERLINSTKNETCIIGFPRMKLSSKLNLNNALHSLGLQSLFDPRTADLSLVSSGYGQIPAPQATLAPLPVPVPQVTLTPQPAPVSQATSIPQVIPLQTTPIAQALPHTSRQLSSVQPDDKNKEYLIFSRNNFGNTNSQGVTSGMRRNYFTYDDKIRGISVEQWDTGFSIRKSVRTRRDVQNGRHERNDMKPSNDATYVVENDDLGKVAPKIDDANTKYVSLEENKYRFRDAKRKIRRRRQSRPMDQNFLKFMQTQSFPSYGLDILRNSPGLVNPGLYANEVLHKVEMDVTEKGTEAAATTAVLLRRDGNQKKLVANRPFIFFIRHDPTKLILFWGTVNAPTPNYAVVR
ncbi:hypothetical protein P5V15_007957 [Pogonomyrmex californicus]